MPCFPDSPLAQLRRLPGHMTKPHCNRMHVASQTTAGIACCVTNHCRCRMLTITDTFGILETVSLAQIYIADRSPDVLDLLMEESVLVRDSADDETIESVLELSERAFRELFPILPKEWLSLDLSTPQLKVVLLLLVNGPCRMSAIASALGVSLATGTGVVDRLVERDIVVREGDPEDRRVVLCRLSPKGEEMLVGLWKLARDHAEMMFRALSVEKIMAIRAGLEALLEAGEATKDQLGISTGPTEVAASPMLKAARPKTKDKKLP